MTIEELTHSIDEFAWADILAVRFSANGDLVLLVSVPNDDSKLEFEINCKSVCAFRLSDNYTDWMEIENDAAEIQGYCGAATTYIMWGDSVDWPKVIGRMTQEFARLPEVFTAEYIRETKKYRDYRLPITIPKKYDSLFHSLLNELGVNAYIHCIREEKDKMQLLRFGERSFIVAQEYEVNDARAKTTAPINHA